MKGKFRNGLKGGSNYIDPSVNGYQFDSPDFNNDHNLINSGRITMDKVPFPVLGEDNLGNRKMMQPNMEYQFPGTQVLETPMHQMPDGSMMNGESHGSCSECDDDEYEYLELSDDEVEEYRLGGYLVEMQDGGEDEKFDGNTEGGKKAYEEYQKKISSFLGEHKGEEFDLIENKLLPKHLKKYSDYNCIGSACNAMKESGADVTPTASNTDFWENAQKEDSNFDVIANNTTKDYSNIIMNLKPGDVLGHNYPSKTFGDRNGIYPEHSQEVIKVEDGFVYVLDGQGSEGYRERKYPVSKFINEGGPYDNTWIARPNSFNGEKYRGDLPQEKNPYFKGAISDDVELDLKPMNWSKGLSALNTYDLDEDQYEQASNIIKIVQDKKEDFIRKTGMSEKDYDEIMQYLPSIANQETDLGNSIGGKGLTKNPTRAIYEGAKTAVSTYPSDGLMQVRNQYIDSKRGDNLNIVALAKKFGINDKNYDPDNLEQNVLLSMFLINDINKNVDKRFKKKGNNQNLSKVEKVLYDYNSYGSASKGTADGLLTYMNKIVNGKDNVLASDERKKLMAKYNEEQKKKQELEDKKKEEIKSDSLYSVLGSKF